MHENLSGNGAGGEVYASLLSTCKKKYLSTLNQINYNCNLTERYERNYIIKSYI